MDRTYEHAWAALSTVVDPELDQPITELGFVSALMVSPDRNVTAWLQLPTVLCGPNFAYLMAADAIDALEGLDWTRSVVVELVGHPESKVINAGLAASTRLECQGNEAHEDLERLRTTFRRKAHAAAMERSLTELLRSRADLGHADLGRVRIGDLPASEATWALLRRRAALGLSTRVDKLVLVRAPHDERGDSFPWALIRTRNGEGTYPTLIPMTDLTPSEN